MVGHPTNMDGFAFRITNQPIGRLDKTRSVQKTSKWCEPYAGTNPRFVTFRSHACQPMRRVSRLGAVFSTRRTHNSCRTRKKSYPSHFEILGFPFSVRDCCSRVQTEIIGCPAPPTHRCWCCNTSVVELSNQGSDRSLAVGDKSEIYVGLAATSDANCSPGATRRLQRHLIFSNSLAEPSTDSVSSSVVPVESTSYAAICFPFMQMKSKDG